MCLHFVSGDCGGNVSVEVCKGQSVRKGMGLVMFVRERQKLRRDKQERHHYSFI